MPSPNRDAAYLWDILHAARAARKFLGSSKLEEYLRNEMLQAAVERKVEIIGESARRISDSFKRTHPEIPWKSIVAQRNVMVHDYGEIKPERIWALVKIHLPELEAKLEPLLPPLPPELELHEPHFSYLAKKIKKSGKNHRPKGKANR